MQHTYKNLRKRTASIVLLAMILVVATPGIAHAAVPANPPAGGTLQQRIALRKNEFKVILEPKDEQRLKSRCNSIQSIFRDAQQALPAKVDNYQQKYLSIDAKLLLAIGKLKLADRDTLELEKQRTALASRVTVLDTTLTNYRQSIDDVVIMNCEADLVGFKSMIEATRAYHDTVRIQTSGIRIYLVDTIKSTLTGHITALQPKTTE